ncbi:hypothetical protein ACUSIJ_17815 [Pseudochelatococcus sp. B33]
MTASLTLTGYEFWQRAMETGEKPDPDSEPQFGRYRLPSGGGAYAVAVWPDEGGITQVRVNKQTFGADGEDREKYLDFIEGPWARCIAVSNDDYEHAVQKGTWPDGTPTRSQIVGRHGKIGHNSQPDDFEVLKGNIEELLREADKIVAAGAAADQGAADFAANLKKRLTVAQRQAEAGFKAEKDPIDKALKEVREKWTPWIDGAKVRVSRIRDVVEGPYLRAEKAKSAAEAKARTEAAGAPVEARKVSAGSKGAKTVLKTYWRAEIVDYDAALQALKDHPNVRDAVSTIANAAARSAARVPIAGVKFISEERAV